MNVIEPVTSDFSVSCSYFEFDEKMNDKFNTYLEYSFSEGYTVYDTMFIFLKFLLDNYFSQQISA